MDLVQGRCEPLAFCPAYLRGLASWENNAIVGLSRPRWDDWAFTGLALDEKLAAKQSDPQCGLLERLSSGAVAHWLRLEGAGTELYDVQVLLKARRPMALGFQTDEIARLLALDPMATL